MVSGKIAQALEHSIGKELDKSVDKGVVQVGFKRLTEDAVTPTKAHATDSGYDLVASKDVIINPGETAVVSTGIAVRLPKGFEAQVRPRSGVTSKTKLRIALGTIDNSYKGEIGVIVDNIAKLHHNDEDRRSMELRTLDNKSTNNGDWFPRYTYIIRKGDKLAQLVITRLPDVEAVEVFDVGETSRGSGGFGSSGIR